MAKSSKMATRLVTSAYGLHSVEARRPLWQGLKHLASGVCLPWLILGDFNSLLHIDDRWGGTLKTIGPYYSWSNKGIGDGRTLSRIDLAFGNSDWFYNLEKLLLNIVILLFLIILLYCWIWE
ncbi:Galactinol--sucrose galactosyltransferase, partial [Bienertia sinuspersici]